MRDTGGNSQGGPAHRTEAQGRERLPTEAGKGRKAAPRARGYERDKRGGSEGEGPTGTGESGAEGKTGTGRTNRVTGGTLRRDTAGGSREGRTFQEERVHGERRLKRVT